MGEIDTLADEYVRHWAALDPVGATHVGIGDSADRLTDLSPDGYAALAELDRTTLRRLDALTPDRDTGRLTPDTDRLTPKTDSRRLAAAAMRERLEASLALYDSGETTSQLNVLTSALHQARAIFDLMPLAGEQNVANVVARLAALPTALTQYATTLRHAAASGHVSARRQILEVAGHCRSWTDPAGDSFFPGLHGRILREGSGGSEKPLPAALRADLDRALTRAGDAVAAFGRFLSDELADKGLARDAVGRERYARFSRFFLGTEIDLEETYAWGFAELERLEREADETARAIVPGGGVTEAIAWLERQPGVTITGRDEFRAWMQELIDRTVDALDGTHFDIPAQVRRIECCLAPTSDGGIYYTGPSEDFERPGRMWWAVPRGQNTFATWREVTTVFHEGVPGHHLQVGQAAARPQLLNRWQRLLSWCSGHGEGWALYAERLMDELGFLSNPGDRLGMLDGQALRAVRVIVDIGMHLELTIPRDNPFGFHPGERWTPELGWEFLRTHCRAPESQLRFELNRYLGWPGQAPAYKVGERTWLAVREQARAAAGGAFDLKEFHRRALDLGSLGLDPFVRALAT